MPNNIPNNIPNIPNKISRISSISNNKSDYYRLKTAYTYSCDLKNNDYKTINNGNNCLCPSGERSVFDTTDKNSWPMMDNKNN